MTAKIATKKLKLTQPRTKTKKPNAAAKPPEAASPAVLKALLAVFPPGTMVLPVGGMAAGSIGPWRAAGAAGFGLGSSLYKPGDGPEIVAERAKALRQALGMG